MDNYEEELQQENIEAAIDLSQKNMDDQVNQYPVYGEYDMVPLNIVKKEQLEEALEGLQTAIWPTYSQLRKKQNLQEIQDTISRDIKRNIGKFTTCMTNARDRTDSDYCADILINYLKGDGTKYALNVCREY